MITVCVYSTCTCITISVCSTCTCIIISGCIHVLLLCVYVLGLQRIVVFGIQNFSLTNVSSGICLLSRKYYHNLFLVKYQKLALHFAVTNCYTCLYQQSKFLKLFIQYSTAVASWVTWSTKLFPWPFNWNYNLTCSILYLCAH